MLSRPWVVSVTCHRVSWETLHHITMSLAAMYDGSCWQSQYLGSWGRGLPWVLGQSSLKSEALSQKWAAPFALFQHKILVGDFLLCESQRWSLFTLRPTLNLLWTKTIKSKLCHNLGAVFYLSQLWLLNSCMFLREHSYSLFWMVFRI